MIYDCFLFNGEYDALEIRLEELRGIVDKHCLFEADRTFQGEPKPGWYGHGNRAYDGTNVETFPIELPVGLDPWEAERYCRDAMAHRCGAQNQDWVLVSDADEIVRRGELIRATRNGPAAVHAFDLRNFYYLLDWELPTREMALPVLARAYMFRDYGATELRKSARQLDVVHPDAGWHFSMLGFKPEQIVEKLNSFAHSELNGTLSIDDADACIRLGLDCVNGRNLKLEAVDIDDTFPESVQLISPTRLTRQGWR